MNRKAFTTIELIVSFVLVSVIVFFLFQIIFILKDLLFVSGLKNRLLSKQIILAEMINKDFNERELIVAFSCKIEYPTETDCVKLIFKDGEAKQLSYNRSDNSVTYGYYKTYLVEGSKIGNIDIKSEVLVEKMGTSKLNSLLHISIPIYHKSFKEENFGINVNYLYGNNVSLSGLSVIDYTESEKNIFLINQNDISYRGFTYVDPGYYVLDSGGINITDTTEVSISSINGTKTGINVRGEIGNEVGKTYTLTYTIRNLNGDIISEQIRNVTVLETEYVYSYKTPVELTISDKEFVAPVNGEYRIELWGASGGGNTIMKGKGGYASGTIELNKSDILYINIGGEGKIGAVNVSAEGGYNGGGNSGSAPSSIASSGGGSTDIRKGATGLGNRIMVAGGGGGGGSRNDSIGTCKGGDAGNGSTPNHGNIDSGCDITYVGKGATVSLAGVAANAVSSTPPTAGGSLVGGAGGTCNISGLKAGGGGGGGYYGGGGGTCYGGGGGGSGYCNDVLVSSCNVNSGASAFSSTQQGKTEIGHVGNGYVRITLMYVYP